MQTNSSGVVQVDNLPPGTYTVTEQLYDKYVPVEASKVSIIGGQVSTVSFNNKLKRGKLTVILCESNVKYVTAFPRGRYRLRP